MSKKKENIGFVEGVLVGRNVIADSNDETRELYDKTRYGELFKSNKFQYALLEALVGENL